MRSVKQAYVSQVKDYYNAYSYSLTLNIEHMSTSTIHRLKQMARTAGIVSLHNKVAQKRFAQRAVSDTLPPAVSGQTLTFYAADEHAMKRFFTRVQIEDYFFYKANEPADIDYALHGNTNVKAGPLLPLFEQIAQFKIAKGVIQLLKPLHLLVKSKKVGVVEAEILKRMNLRLKVRRPRVVEFVKIVNGRKSYYSDTYVKSYFDHEFEAASIRKVAAMHSVLT